MKTNAKLLALPLALSLFAVGCGTSSNQQAGQGNKAKTELEQIKANGKILIGTEGTYAPFTFHDKSGNLTGFDVDIAKEVAKRLGVQPQFVETQWDGMIAGLDAKRFDVVANEVSIREDRKKKYDFSDPYIVSKPVLIVNKDNTTIKSFDDLKGKKSAQSLTSNLTDIAKSKGAEIVATDGFNQAIDLLASKRVDATVNDGLSYLDLVKQKPDVPVKKVAEYPQATPSGIMMRKGNTDLVTAIDKALADMKQDGTYLKISENYFGADVSK
jgi:L-cystine transport system substrate-binding protein